MTKEELEKEATAYALEWGDKTDGTYACCRDGYLAGAEPREKRIAELEEKVNGVEFINKQLNEQLLQKSSTNHQLVEQLAKLNERCSELEAEVNRLKLNEQLAVNNGKNLLKENAELNETLGKCAKMPVLYCLGAKETITKAKDLLKQWLQTSKASGCDNINIVTDTEQFLNEVEK